MRTPLSLVSLLHHHYPAYTGSFIGTSSRLLNIFQAKNYFKAIPVWKQIGKPQRKQALSLPFATTHPSNYSSSAKSANLLIYIQQPFSGLGHTLDVSKHAACVTRNGNNHTDSLPCKRHERLFQILLFFIVLQVPNNLFSDQ